jgi:NAD-dependent dihydropyrimidine dehydrogenase PreA subunit
LKDGEDGVATRQIIRIDESLCNGCGQCVPACAEGALEIVDGKARVAAELLCDGLGACIGECPEGALVIEVREAEEFDEVAVEGRLRELGRPSLAASGHDHSAHAGHPGASHPDAGHPHAGHGHGDQAHAGHLHPSPSAAPSAHMGCPGSLARELRQSDLVVDSADTAVSSRRPEESLLQNWPVQLGLVNPHAPFLRHADLLIAADCAPTAYRLFHEDFLQGRSLVIACPKLDDAQAHYEKLAVLFQTAQPRSVNVVRMEVPCCSGLVAIAQKAAEAAGLDVPIQEIVIGVGGECQTPQALVAQPAVG